MSKICIYTCITGDYDNLKEYKYRDDNYDYVCFTNNKSIKSNFWNMVYLDDELDNLTLARKIKILGHEELKKYDLTIWLDGAMQLRKPLSTFISECCDLKKYDMIGFNHRERDCIYDEIDACVYLYKETIENAKKIETFLRKEKYPQHNGLIESTVLVRKNNDEVKKLMSSWYDILFKYSRRDQLSFNYCLWKNPIKINMLNMNVFDNEYFVHEGHSNAKFSKKYRVYFGNSKDYDFKKVFDYQYDYDGEYYVANINVPFDCDRIELMISPYDVVLVEKVDSNYLYETDCWNINDNKFFVKFSKIVFNHNFTKGDNLNVCIKLTAVDIIKSLEIFSKYNASTIDLYNKNISLSNQLYETNQELQKILNSKGWKFLEKIRKIKK